MPALPDATRRSPKGSGGNRRFQQASTTLPQMSSTSWILGRQPEATESMGRLGTQLTPTQPPFGADSGPTSFPHVPMGGQTVLKHHLMPAPNLGATITQSLEAHCSTLRHSYGHNCLADTKAGQMLDIASSSGQLLRIPQAQHSRAQASLGPCPTLRPESPHPNMAVFNSTLDAWMSSRAAR